MADAGGVCTAAYAADAALCNDEALAGSPRSSKCVAYAAQYSDALKRNRSMGWSPSCVLDPSVRGGHGKCKEYQWTRYVEVGNRCIKSTSWVKVPCGSTADPTALAAPPTTGPCVGYITASDVDTNPGMPRTTYNVFSPGGARYPLQDCFVPVQDSVVCLYNQGTTDILFDQIASYGPRGFSDFMSVVTLAGLILYFVTSSDSGSLVVDIISANGHTEPPMIQRIMWSFTEGATACALLAAGRNLEKSDGSLRALQSASMIMGLPYTFLLFWCAQGLVLLVKEEVGELRADRKAFGTFIFAPGASPLDACKRLCRSLFVPGIALGRVVSRAGGWLLDDPTNSRWFWTAAFQCVYVATFVFLLLGVTVLYQWQIIAGVIHIGFGTFVGFLRNQVRRRSRILHGDLLTDVLCGVFATPFAVAQLEAHLDEEAAGQLPQRSGQEVVPAVAIGASAPWPGGAKQDGSPFVGFLQDGHNPVPAESKIGKIASTKFNL
uniref:Uncharacterized protein n=1 Tax=Zooxanthella nutricula TaxID=1333877 RepID=A0A7S2MVK1_9DINO